MSKFGVDDPDEDVLLTRIAAREALSFGIVDSILEKRPKVDS